VALAPRARINRGSKSARNGAEREPAASRTWRSNRTPQKRYRKDKKQGFLRTAITPKARSQQLEWKETRKEKRGRKKKKEEGKKKREG
jgi:hypothetical protein